MSEQANRTKKEILLNEADEALRQAKVIKAMEIYYRLHELEPESVDILNKLVSLNLHLKLDNQAIVYLNKLIALEPTLSVYYDQLANLHALTGHFDLCCKVYQALILQRPKYPDAHFNLAFYLRKQDQSEEAIKSYQQAIILGIDKAEEVYLNIAVIYADDLRQESEAESNLMQALSINSQYVPALYNLANIYEDRGDKEKTLEYFNKIITIKPDHVKALSRIAGFKKFSSKDDPHLLQLKQHSNSPDCDFGDKVDAFYALGKAYNDCAEYQLAFDNYVLANQLNALEMEKYNKANTEEYFDAIIQNFSEEWVKNNSCNNSESPIFICGLFRTGSTLVEQMLASHPNVTAGGEREFFVREMSQPEINFPLGLKEQNSGYLFDLAKKYINNTNKLFPGEGLVTDKRPDNFVYIGLIKTIFPKAKIIYTTRDPIDNCLSVYFARLSSAQNYAVNLESIAHYYDQQTHLLKYWKSLFSDDLHVINYDDMIENPREQLESALNFINLEWHDDCLNFHQLKNAVKTASVWQVRQPLYKESSGRWRNYQSNIADLLAHYERNQ